MTISKRVPLEILRPGIALSQAIVDPERPRLKLLGKGVELTPAFLEALKRRGIDSVILSNDDIAVLTAFASPGRRTTVPPAHQYPQSDETNDYSSTLDDRIDTGTAPELDEATIPLAASIDTPSDCGYADGLKNQWAHENNCYVDQVTEFFDDTVNCRATDVGPLFATSQKIIDKLSEDKDALVCLSSTPHDSSYPSRHGIHLASVAMAIGVEMGLDQSQLIDLGVGCLIHDVGMRAVGLGMFQSKQILSPLQLRRLADHPVLALEIAGEFGEAISDQAKLVCYQIHERIDGSGYPRGWRGHQIHLLARIAAVADAYVGMLTSRKHRTAIQGYYVMVNLLEQMKQGKFEPSVVRGLLNTSSLYPLGSFVTLNNECVGRVIRSGRDRFVEPTIEMWHQDHRDREPVIVNLKREPSIRITGSTVSMPMPQQRAA